MTTDSSHTSCQGVDNGSGVIEAPRYSCAFAGVYAAVLETDLGIPILHSGGGCGFTQYMAMSLGAGAIGSGRTGGSNAPCSSLLEEHVVFGGEQKLRNLIKSSIELINGEYFVVISGCIPALIGDDVNAVVSEFKNQAPIVHVDTSGFAGTTYDGYEFYLEAVIDQLLPDIAPEKQNNVVNIFGIAPRQHVFWRGDLHEIKRIFEKLGVSANIFFGELGGLEHLQKIPAAAHNIVLSPWLGVKAAHKLKDKYGTDFTVFPFVPVGPRETTRFLELVGPALKISPEKLESFIRKEENSAYNTFEFLGDSLILGFPNAYYAVVADSSTAIGVTRYLTNDTGYIPEVVIVTDNPPEEARETIIRELQDIESLIKPEIIFEVDSHKIRTTLKDRKFLILLASSMEKYLAPEEFHSIHLSVSFPVWDRLILDRTYAGYRGGLALMEDISAKYAGPL